MRHIEVMHGGLFPGDEHGALGLLYGADRDGGDRVTLVADPDWVRMLLAGIGNGHDLGGIAVPQAVSLPLAAQGWDDEWDDEEAGELRHLHWLYRRVGGDWPRLMRVVALMQVCDR